MKKLIILLLVAVIALCLTGCCMSHEWLEATCTVPKTCSKCGETEGTAIPHQESERWVADEEGKLNMYCEYGCNTIVNSQEITLPNGKITVLKVTGFSIDCNQFMYHLAKSLGSSEFSAKLHYSSADSSTLKLYENNTPILDIHWSEGSAGYEDQVYFGGNWGDLDSVFDRLLAVMEGDISKKEISELRSKWENTKYLSKGEGVFIGGKTGMISVYRDNYGGYNLFFNTLKYALGG